MSGWITDELLDSLRRVESGGNRFAVSKAGAKGPYQFMDATAKELGLSDPFDEAQSRGAAKRYLTKLDSMFGNPRDALTAYNWGMGNVSNMLRTGKANMPAEARQYAGKVLGNKMDYFDQPDIDPRIAAAMLRRQQGAPMPGMQPPGLGDPSQLLANFSTAPDPLQQQQYAFQQQPQQGRDIAGLRQRADDAYSEGMKRLDAEPDIAQWQEYAKKRSAEGGQHLMLALAAQQAGKEFEPIGGMYLKQAMAARDPMQVGKAGMITGEGEFIADPFYQREKQADMLLKRSEYFAKLAETAQTQQERAQAAELARQSMAEYRRDALGVQRESNQIRRDGQDIQRSNQGPKPQAVQDKDGNWVYIQPGQPPVPAGVKGPPKGESQPTEDERKARAWFEQANYAVDNIRQLIAQDPNVLKVPTTEMLAGKSPFFRDEMQSLARSPKRQLAEQAFSSLSEAFLRAATGAGVNRDETAQKMRELMPQWGDSPALVEQKLGSLKVYMDALQGRANRAMSAEPLRPALPVSTLPQPASGGIPTLTNNPLLNGQQQAPAGDVRSRSQRYFD